MEPGNWDQIYTYNLIYLTMTSECSFMPHARLFVISWQQFTLSLSQTSPVFMFLQYKSFENTGKRINCLLQAISRFTTVFFTHFKNSMSFLSNSKLSSAKSSVWKSVKFVVRESVIHGFSSGFISTRLRL